MVRPLRYLAAFVLFWLAAFVFPTSPSVARASGNTDPNAGPGGPIVIITNASNPFTGYYAEILRNEGLNAFEVRDISSLTAQSLGAYDVAVLGETLTPLTAAQVDMLTQWTNAGGNLIAMRPDKQLYPLLGLTEAASTGASTLVNGYLLFNPLKPATAGLVNQTIQFHGDADYTLLDATAGSTSVATLYSDATTATRYPAVTVRAVGTSGGQAAAFMFDLARSVVYTRQGNPAWSGLERDGSAPIRSNDLYSGDAQGDWIDFSKVAIPQADEQQRLLAHLVLHLNVSRRPLPRFWYLPRGLKAAVVMTGDDHANGGTIGRFDQYIGFSAPGCNVDNWECVRSTSYIYPNTPITDAQAKSYADQGFEIALHVDTGCADFTPTSLESFYADQLATFHGSFPTLSETATHRVHCVVWSDYDTQPQVELNHGIRLDTNYYYFFPAKGIGNRPGMFTGSGLPMRFATERGSLIDVYQAPTQMTDESGQTYPLTADTLLNNALGPQGYYGVFTANMHTDFNDVNAPKNSMVNSNAIIRSAQAHGVPVVSARQMLTWLDGRNNSSFAITSWDGSLLGFSITVAAGANGLQTMLPVRSGTLRLAGLTRGGAALDYTIATIKGVDYAFFPATTSAYAATYVTDTVSPIITGVNATATGPTSAVVTWTTDEKATSRIDLGTSVESLPSSVTDPSYVTSHSVSLTGLTPATRYYFRVTSGDGAIPSNVATSPAPPSTPASFTTLPPTFVDTTVGDFSRGTTDGSLYIAQTDDGEVILKPQVGNEFTSSTLPSDWFQQVWSPIAGATAEVSGGKLSVDGALVGQNALYGPGRSLEFVATFTDVFQHIGLGTDFNAAPWAMFNSDGQQVYARTNTS